MKFPRNVRIQRGQVEIAPYASVLFLLVILLMLGALLPTPGVPLRLPAADDLPGIDRPIVAVAVDFNTVSNSAGIQTVSRYYFANQIVTNETQLSDKLHVAAKNSRTPLTLVIHADKAVTYEQLVRLTLLARDAGITNALLATLPRLVAAPAKP